MTMLKMIHTCVHRQWLESVQRSGLQCVVLSFVPAYTGMEENERADNLASGATVVDGRAVNRADILNANTNIGRNEFLSNKLGS